MARTADQIVAEQLGQLHLQLVISQARNESLEETVAELSSKVSILETRLAGIGSPAAEGEDTPTPKNAPERGPQKVK